MMAASILITTGLFILIDFPFALLFFAFSALLFVLALKSPSEGSGFTTGLSAIIFGILLFVAFASLDFDRSFKWLLVVLSAIYFLGSLAVYISTNKMRRA